MNIAYIDGANVHFGTTTSGLDLDYKKFRVWLTDKFKIEKAYLFLGNIPKYSKLYAHFQECGFVLVFKEVVYDAAGKPKGNCDADLVLKVTRDFFEKKCSGSLIVSSDGDYAGLVSFLLEQEVSLGVLSPSSAKKCSVLLKRTGVKIYYLDDQITALQKEKSPGRD